MLISLSLGSFIKVNGHSAYNNLLEDQKELESEKEDIHISEPNEIIPLAAYQNIYTKDGWEPNNSKGNASSLGTLISEYSLGLVTGGTLHDSGPNWQTNIEDRDVDYYYFKTTEPYNFKVELKNIPANCDYDIKLYEKGKTWIFFNTYTQVGYSNLGSNSDEIINRYYNVKTKESYSYLPEGEYVIEIYSYRGCSSQRYGLHIGFSGLDDEYEINDTMLTAYQIPSTSSGSSSFNLDIKGTIDRVDDVDYYKFTPSKDNAQVTITLNSPASNYKYKLALYQNSTLITSSYSSNVISDAYTNVQLTKGNTYYIKVYSESAHSTKFKYTLNIKGSNFDTVYNFKDTNNNWIGNGILWTYNESASTTNGYTARKRYSSSESYLYLTKKVYLYNFDALNLGRAIGALEKTVEILEENHTFLGTLGYDSWFAVGGAAYDKIMKYLTGSSGTMFYVGLAYTSYKFFAKYTMTEYEINLLSYFCEQMRMVANNPQSYRIEIDVYKRYGSNEEYIYLKFSNSNDIFAPSTYFDDVYTNYVVYGNLSYINLSQHIDNLNEYIFNTNHYYKNNFGV